VLEHAISKMLSHPLAEVRSIGEELKTVANKEVPTLLKYAAPLPSQPDLEKYFPNLVEQGISSQREDWCQLLAYDPEGENKILASILYRFAGMSCSTALESINKLRPEQRIRLADNLLGSVGEHDAPLRELEHTFYTFDLILDQGGYAEFKRHRMMTQTPQSLTTNLGYATPHLIVQGGFETQYHSAMQAAAQAFVKLYQWNPQVASYVVPNGYNRRILFSLNLREAFAFCQLRSATNAHFSMRRVAQRVAEEIRRVHPILAKYMRLPQESWQQIESDHFSNFQE
jgi:thymidylate synthase ThyX